MAKRAVVGNRRAMENVASERATLGSLLCSPALIYESAGLFRPEIFVLPIHRQIAVAIKELNEAGRSITLPGVLARLPPQTDSDEPFSPEGYLSTLVYDQAEPELARDYLVDLVRMYGRRKMVEGGKQLIEMAPIEDGRDPAEKLEEVFNNLRNDITSGDAPSIPVSGAIAKALGIADKRARGEQAVGLSWFMPELDGILGLMEPADLVAILADAKAGKSSFGINILRHASLSGPVAFFSMEMLNWRVANRMLSQESRVSETVIARGQYSQSEFDSVMEARARLDKLPIEIIDKPRLTMTQIRSKSMEIKRRYGAIVFVLVDQLKVIRSERKYADEFGGISDSMAGLKALANDLDCPVGILMQRTRGSLNRLNPRPTADDAFGGGVTLEGVDTMVGVWRKHKWLEEHPPAEDATSNAKLKYQKELQDLEGKAEIIGLARRYGKPNQSTMCRFIGECGLYESFNKVTQPPMTGLDSEFSRIGY